ncbi:MAG: cysteine desulfurase [Clostridia bacterium]|nr:cysteine desulfurase [Clostridia bacterium]
MEAYLDNSATTRPCEAAVAAAGEALRGGWHNPSALYRPALEAQKRVEAVRERCLKAADARGQRLIFTAGGTEADNLAVFGWLRGVRKPCRVLYLATEHPAITACMQEVERLGHEALPIPVNGEGVCDLDVLETLLTPQTRLICVMQVNNEVGAVQPLRAVAALRDRLCPEAAIHVDGVQGFLRVPAAFNSLGIQSYALSGHKIHACKGIGALIVRKDHRLHPVVFGGGQEEGLRSGTENTVGIAMLGAAVDAFPDGAAWRMAALKQRLLDRLCDGIPQAVVNGPLPGSEQAAPHILNVSLPPVRSQTMLFALEGDGVYVSAGSACASHKQKISPVLSAMRVGAQRADSALRFSLSLETTEDMIDYAADCAVKHYALLSRYVRR